MKHVIFDCDGTLVDTSSVRFKLFPGIRELLEKHSRECLYFVWTARGRSSTLKVLEDLGISSYFDAFSTIDDHGSKLDTRGLVQLVGNAPKESLCVIGDSSHDMLGAKNFGVLAIGASWSEGADEDALKNSGADFIVNHPLECSKLIENYLKGDVNV